MVCTDENIESSHKNLNMTKLTKLLSNPGISAFMNGKYAILTL